MQGLFIVPFFSRLCGEVTKVFCTDNFTSDRRTCNPYYCRSVIVVVVVDIPFFLEVRTVDAPAGVAQYEGDTGFLHLPSEVLALIFYVEKDSAVPRRSWSGIMCTHESIVLHYLLGMFFL